MNKSPSPSPSATPISYQRLGRLSMNLPDSLPTSPFEFPHSPKIDLMQKRVKLNSRSSSGQIMTRPSTAAHSVKSGSHHRNSTASTIFLTEAASPRRAVNSTASIVFKSGYSRQDSKKFSPMIRLKSARSSMFDTRVLSEANSPVNQLRLKTESFINDIIDYQTQASEVESPIKKIRPTSPTSPKLKPTAKLSERKKLELLEQELIPTGLNEARGIIVKDFIHNIKEKIDYTYSRAVQDIMSRTSDPKTGEHYLSKVGLTSPRIIKERNLLKSLKQNRKDGVDVDLMIDNLLLEKTHHLRLDINKKKITKATPRIFKVVKPESNQSQEGTPLILTRSFNSKKFCSARGIKSVAEAIRQHHEKAWEILTTEPHQVEKYIGLYDELGPTYNKSPKNNLSRKNRSPTHRPKMTVISEVPPQKH